MFRFMTKRFPPSRPLLFLLTVCGVSVKKGKAEQLQTWTRGIELKVSTVSTHNT
jgi:hypothetical protein